VSGTGVGDGNWFCGDRKSQGSSSGLGIDTLGLADWGGLVLGREGGSRRESYSTLASSWRSGLAGLSKSRRSMGTEATPASLSSPALHG
jgi:hypothetical protein